jgi:hypothetical protein
MAVTHGMLTGNLQLHMPKSALGFEAKPNRNIPLKVRGQKGDILDASRTRYRFFSQTAIKQPSQFCGEPTSAQYRALSLHRSDDAEIRETVQDELNRDRGQQQAHQAG